MEGWLYKRYPLTGGKWVPRWCVLTSSEFKTYATEKSQEYKLSVQLQASVRLTPFHHNDVCGNEEGNAYIKEKSFGFVLHDDDPTMTRLYYFAAQDVSAMEAWSSAIRCHCNGANQIPGSSANRWTVEVDRSSGEPLGIDLDTSTLQVRSVDWKGLVGAWNLHVTDPENKVTSGDWIAEVNGQVGADAILAECKKEQLLKLVVVRSSPIVKMLPCGQFTAVIDRTAGDKLGVDLDPDTLKVKYVDWKGLMGSWNVEYPLRAVKVGDRIMEVNGKRIATEVLAECSKSIVLKMTIARDTKPGEFSLEVDRSTGQSLGLDIDPSTMIIKSVDWKGLVGDWNVHSLDPEKTVKAGDKIVEVNRQRGFDKILAECGKSQPLQIVISPKDSIHTDFLKPGHWRITIDRSSGEPLGLEFDSASLQVKSVSWNGLVGDWNTNNPDRSIKPNDRIVLVNHKREVSEVLQELSSSPNLEIVMARDLEPGEWRIEIDRSLGEPLGVEMDYKTLAVKSIDWKGLIGSWNVHAPHPAHIVKTGDKIVEVNRQRGVEKMLEECKKFEILHVVMLRPASSPNEVNGGTA